MDAPTTGGISGGKAAVVGVAVLALAAALGGWFLLGTLGGAWSPVDRLFVFPADGAAWRTGAPWTTRQPVRDVSLAAVESLSSGADPRPQRIVNLALHFAAAALFYGILLGDLGRRDAAGTRGAAGALVAASAWLVNPSAWPLLLSLEGRGPLLETFFLLATFATARSAVGGSILAGVSAGLAAAGAVGSGPLGGFAFLLAAVGLASAEKGSTPTLSWAPVWKTRGGSTACLALAVALGLAAAWQWRAPAATTPEGWAAGEDDRWAAPWIALQELGPALFGVFSVVDPRPAAAGSASLASLAWLGAAVFAIGAFYLRPARTWPWCAAAAMLLFGAFTPRTAVWGGLTLLAPAALGWLGCARLLLEAFAPGPEPSTDGTAASGRAWLAYVPAAAGALGMACSTGASAATLKSLGTPVAFWELQTQRRPLSAADWARLGDALRRARKFAPAEEALQKALELKPNFPAALAWRGETALATMRWDEAKRWFKLAQLEARDAEEALAGWCDYAYKKYDPAELTRWQASADALYPRSQEARWRRARALVVRNRGEEAEQLAWELLREDPTLLEPRFTLAEVHLGRNEPEKALEVLKEALALDPDSPRGNYMTAVAYAVPKPGLQDWSKTAEYDLKAAQADPYYFEPRYHGAFAMQNLGRMEESARLAAEAQPLTDAAAPVLMLESQAQLALGRTAEAAALLEKSADAQPEWFEPIYRLGWLRAVHPDPAIRRPEEAVRLARRLIAQPQQRDPRAWDLLAAGLAGERRFDEAVAAANEAINRAVTAGRDDFALDVRQRRDLLYAVGQPYLEAPASALPRQAP